MNAPNWSHTLNLPEYKLEMRAKLPTNEPVIMQKWSEKAWWETLEKIMSTRKMKILHDGPPYANGPIHIGHAVNKTLKDIINRSFLLDGYGTYYQPGWDCHGLPIELKVEQKLKIRGSDDPLKFITACREFASQQIDEQKMGFERLGVMAQWEKSYTTMQPEIEANSMRVLANLFEQNYISKGMRPVHWCNLCRSALAEAEIDYADMTTDAIYVSFPVIETDQFNSLVNVFKLQQKLSQSDRLAFLIWTTTPWTIPSNVALCINADLQYAIYSITDNQNEASFSSQYVIMAQQCSTEFANNHTNITLEQVSAAVQGSNLIGLHARHPLHKLGYDRVSSIIAGDHVTAEQGTGIVHTAPDHGMEDWMVCRDNNLLLWQMLLDSAGEFIESTPLFAGLPRIKANEKVNECLQQENALISKQQVSHSVGHCWRHKKPIFFRATPQWFITMDNQKLRENCLSAIEKVNFYPARSKERLKSMIEDRPDWCISRQRYWGLPVGLLVNKQTEEPHPQSAEILRKIADKVQQHGVEVWHQLSVADLIGQQDSELYYKSNDILDVWFDSGVTHSSVLKGAFYQNLPENCHTIYLEGSDQHRGWFQSSLITSVALQQKAPYQDLITHGFVIDDHGEKMSKSLGNVKSPDAFYKKLGADILRLWVASSDYTAEIVLSDQVIEQKSDIYRRIRNTIRFLYGNCNDYDGEIPEQLVDLDLWLWRQAKSMSDEVIEDYRTFQYPRACRRIHIFCREVLGAFYLDIIKDRLYTLPANSPARRSAQAVMQATADLIVALIAPILPYTAEQAWQAHHESDKSPESQDAEHIDSIFFHTWSEIQTKLAAFDASQVKPVIDWPTIAKIMPLIHAEIEKSRASGILKSSMAAKIKITPHDDDTAQLLNRITSEAKFIFLVADMEVLPTNVSLAQLLIEVVLAQGEKCSRCWYIVNELNDQQICARCAENITQDSLGEQRLLA